MKALAKLAEAVRAHNAENGGYAALAWNSYGHRKCLGLAVLHEAFASMENLKADETDAVRKLREQNPAEVRLVREISELATKGRA